MERKTPLEAPLADQTLPPTPSRALLPPSNIIIGALGCTWKPLSSRSRLSKNYYFGDTFYMTLLAETPGNPWKPFGNPFGNPSEPPVDGLCQGYPKRIKLLQQKQGGRLKK